LDSRPSAPFPITEGLGNAIAGQPIAIRFIDARKQREARISAIISLSC
jgi:hypothetical protein